jgi:hypothetical protein
LKGWNIENGTWRKPSQIWNVDQNIPDNSPNDWLSNPGGDYYIGISFHISPFTIVEGDGALDSNTSFSPSDFYLARNQDPYNSWGVNAVKRGFINSGCMEYWDWLPGITIINKNEKYTLPSEELSAFAGTEWADNDFRIFHGLFSDAVRDDLIAKYLKDINNITGPRFSGWPFGYRQLKDAVFVWVHSESEEIHAMLLASSVQSGDKHSYFNRNLYDPGTKLGAWDNKPSSWDCRQVLKFLYKSRLLLKDGFHEIALVSASSAVERAFFEIVLFLENNDAEKAKNKIKSHSFRERAKTLINSYGYALPTPLFNGLTDAYKARNSIAHELNTYSHDMASHHINQLESVIEWYYQNI